ncbi:MAG: aminodeoxychorismate/anthranilate synthase component II [Alphaproteobacteria bacterium]|nr:aminodeoxychorismate/anthranilate synthase component II [Alphaproteobacteria bacterium]
MFLLIDNYDSFTWNLVHFLGELGVTCDVHRNDALSVDDVFAREPEAVVISPGPSDPDHAGICLDVVAKAADVRMPLLGVCLGHQTIGQAFGGKIVRAPEPMHGKVDRVRHTGAGPFRGLPNPLEATRYHSLAVAEESLPNCFDVTARTDDGVIMGLSHKELPIHGVQFHPESIATEAGHDLLANFIELATGRAVSDYGDETRAGEMMAL